MARYTERAENTARMLDANYQLSLLPQSDEYAELGWRAMRRSPSSPATMRPGIRA